MTKKETGRKRGNGLPATHDATGAKRAEEALRESEARFRSTLEGMMEGCLIIGFDWRYLYANDAVARRTRRSKEELIGYTMMEMHPGIENTKEFARLRRCMEERVPDRMEWEYAYPDGVTAWFDVSVEPVPEGIFMLFLNVTERKLAEEALRQSEEQYRSLIETARDVIYTVSADGTLLSLNPAFETISGWSRAEWLGRPFAAIIHPDDLPAVMEDFRTVLEGEVPPTGEYRMLAKSGQYLTVETVPRPLIVDGKVVGTFGIARDITERGQAEAALRQSEERYRELVELSPDAMVVHSEEKMVFVNAAAVQLFGAAAADEIIGKAIWDFVPPDFTGAVRKRIQGRSPYGKKVDLVEEKLARLDGQVIDVEMTAIPVTYQGKAARQVVLRDINERKRMEEALQSARDELESSVERRMERGIPYGLTFRELTVLHLVANGKSDRDIGAVLGISPLTVQKHIENLRAKMKASSRTEASVRAIREGLVD